MPPRAQDVTDAERAVLEQLWNHGPATIRRLADALYPGGDTAQYATVQKLLQRLEVKGWVTRSRASSAHVFSAVAGREALIGRRLQQTADELCGGSLSPLLTHLVEQVRLDPEERDGLRALIEQLDGNDGEASA